MRRREFIAGLGSAVAWPEVVRAQQAALPIIGFLSSESPDLWQRRLGAFRQGLSEGGYVEGRDVTFEYRLAENRLERLPALAAELVQRRVSMIVALPTPAAAAAKAATNSIPIIFVVGVDPVKSGLVASLARPGGHVTGLSNVNEEIAAKRVEVLRKVLPAASSIAYLANPTNLAFTEPESKQVQVAADKLGVHLLLLNATDRSEFDAAFASLRPYHPRNAVGHCRRVDPVAGR
jgi:putative tryptophan/tyrosine transport system substrate-binding protein